MQKRYEAFRIFVVYMYEKGHTFQLRVLEISLVKGKVNGESLNVVYVYCLWVNVL